MPEENKKRLVWDAIGEKIYETGTDRGVVYPYTTTEQDTGFTFTNEEAASVTFNKTNYGPGYAWNGLTAVTESPSGAEATDLYADNTKYLTMRSAEKFGATVEAYTYPEKFAELDGTASLLPGVRIGQQSRGSFGFAYRTLVGNDTQLENYGYQIHLLYGCTASPSEKAYQTVNDSPEAITFSWEFSTTPVPVIIGGVEYKPTASLTIDTTKFLVDNAQEGIALDQAKKNLEALEKALYGEDSQSIPFLPLPAQVAAILSAKAAE